MPALSDRSHPKGSGPTGLQFSGIIPLGLLVYIKTNSYLCDEKEAKRSLSY